jgi:hypothetical protein
MIDIQVWTSKPLLEPKDNSWRMEIAEEVLQVTVM